MTQNNDKITELKSQAKIRYGIRTKETEDMYIHTMTDAVDAIITIRTSDSITIEIDKDIHNVAGEFDVQYVYDDGLRVCLRDIIYDLAQDRETPFADICVDKRNKLTALIFVSAIAAGTTIKTPSGTVKTKMLTLGLYYRALKYILEK